jgi:hypothetical protein
MSFKREKGVNAKFSLVSLIFGALTGGLLFSKTCTDSFPAGRPVLNGWAAKSDADSQNNGGDDA